LIEKSLFSLWRKSQVFKPGDLSSITSAKEDEAQEKKPARYLPRIPRAEARGGSLSARVNRLCHGWERKTSNFRL